MKKFIKHNIILLIFTIILTSQAVAANKILPAPKPAVDKEIKKIVKTKKLIIPKKKPVKKGINESDETKEIVELESLNELEKTPLEEVFIYPKSKPVIYKKEIQKTVKKSSVLSKRDFKIAQESFKAIKNKKWKLAINTSKKARDKMLYNLVSWLHLRQPINAATFYDYLNFINTNSDYPRINRLRYLAEHKINSKIPTSVVLKWFEDSEPLSSFGKIKLGEIYIEQGNYEKGSKLIKDGWLKAKLTKSDLKYLKRKYKKIITSEDVIKRADWLAWENKYWDLQRILRYLPKDYQLLYTARQLLMSKSYGVDNAIKKVPEKFKNDLGLQYDRLKWRRKRGRIEPSLEILLNVPNDPKQLVRPEIWWVERAIISRSLIYKKKYPLAYKIASNHALIEGPEYAEAEWLSGWIALTFLDDPNLALQHFKNFYNNVGYPISLSRGGYWLGKTYKVINNKQKSDEWFNNASQYLNTYYGQLSFIEMNSGKEFALTEQKKVSEKYQKQFNKNPLIRSVFLLKELNQTKYVKDIVKHLALLDVDKGSEILAGKLSIQVGRYDYAIQIAKNASYEKRFFNELNYPIIKTPDAVNKKVMPNSDIILAVIRQESEFDEKANSSVGARGMMQIMTYTAKLLAKQSNLPYSKSRLISDPSYNIKLGSYYLAQLLEEYEGSYPFTLAAYNAGPKRVKYWKKLNGNPQKGKISYVDWIELIKFKETRNYVQRVLENINVYKYILSGKPIKIDNFFVNHKLY